MIDYFNGVSKVVELINKYEGKLYITPIVLSELLEGAYLSNNQEKELNKIMQLFCVLEFMEYDMPSCKIFGLISTMLLKQGKRIKDTDLMIASITLSNDATLITQDQKHFNIEGLKTIIIEN